ncbi:cardiolipin synthase [Arboricoccus pini]|uniref:CDP-diacylglycerol--glycerol-3-phosphate 3-phosphatidyltransferase n=1 Tax=Arboricoccus pini TaxID=1963835 RepID=A0A212Q888_9PROT|nr:CDP-alcohol phosphatidyltransferase family protein [Arboricoccus pini]SNB55542.1 cardiolipin synthase [Arboricoccus pini]
MAIATSGCGEPGSTLERTRSGFLSLLPFYVANFLTLARIGIVPPLLYAIHDGHFVLGLLLFVAAAASDGLDGFIARRFASQSRLGATLDPLADKLLVNGLYGFLAVQGALPFWLFIAVMSRDLAILSGGLFVNLKDDRRKVRPLVVGKLSTFLQFALAMAALMAQAGWITALPAQILVPAVAAMTAVSAVVYLGVVLTPVAGSVRS